MKFFSILVLAITCQSLIAQDETNDLYRSIADNLCTHLDSLEKVEYDAEALLPSLLSIELGDLVDYLPEDQREIVEGWDGNMFLAMPFVKSLAGTIVFANFLENCPGAANRFLMQRMLMTEDSTLALNEDWKRILNFAITSAGPSALAQETMTFQMALLKIVSEDDEAAKSFAEVRALVGTENALGALMAGLSKELPGVATRHYPEAYESVILGNYFSEIGIDSVVGLIAIIDAQDDIDEFCSTWEADGNVEELDPELPMQIISDTETKELFSQHYNGPEISEIVMSNGAGAVLLVGVLTGCDAYKTDLRNKGINDAIELLDPTPKEKEEVKVMADQLCTCIVMGSEGGQECLSDLLKSYGLTDEDMAPGAELNPKQQRYKEVLVTLVPQIAATCAQK